MIDNPYARLVTIMRAEGSENNPTTYIVGSVTNTSPLRIKVDQIQLDKSDLLINDMLLKGYKRNVIINNTLQTIEIADDYLNAGDKVLLLPSDDNQQFIVVCKLV